MINRIINATSGLEVPTTTGFPEILKYGTAHIAQSNASQKNEFLRYSQRPIKLSDGSWDYTDKNIYNFKNLDSSKSNLAKNNLSKFNLVDCNLQDANLSGASLMGARFDKTNLSGANLTGANLMSADFSTANLDGADLRGAINVQKAKFPPFMADVRIDLQDKVALENRGIIFLHTR